MIGTSASSRPRCAPRRTSRVAPTCAGDSVELHDQVLDHGQLESRMPGEAEGGLARLPEQRPAVIGLREHSRLRGRNRPVAHVERHREAFRQIAVQGVRRRAQCAHHFEVERCGTHTSAFGQRQDLRPETDADDGHVSSEAAAGERDLRGKGGKIAFAGAAPWSAAEQDQAIGDTCGLRQCDLARKRAVIAKRRPRPSRWSSIRPRYSAEVCCRTCSTFIAQIRPSRWLLRRPGETRLVMR